MSGHLKAGQWREGWYDTLGNTANVWLVLRIHHCCGDEAAR